MIAITEMFCDSSHWGNSWTSRPGRFNDNATDRPPSASSSSHWYTTSATCNRSYLLAGLRAGLIALVLLAVLAVIVWF